MQVKNSWEKEIEKDYWDKRNSISFALGDEDNIQKSVVSEIQYSDSDLKFIQKKGAEIKEKLIMERAKIVPVIAQISTFLSQKQKEIGLVPMKKRYSVNSNSFNDNYGYDQMKANDVEVAEGDEAKPEVVVNSKAMREYNNTNDAYHNHCRELKFLNTLIENINEKKEYKLPIKVATELGF